MTAMPPPTVPPVPLPACWEAFRTELALFYRELPRLIRERDEGKYFVAKGDKEYGVWDTFHDAAQFGHLTFPDGQFMAQRIDHRLLPALAAVFGPHPEVDEEFI